MTFGRNRGMFILLPIHYMNIVGMTWISIQVDQS